MKAIVIDKKHLTLVSHTNGVTITCCNVYTAEITNALLNCGFPASDIVSTYKSYIAFSNIN